MCLWETAVRPYFSKKAVARDTALPFLLTIVGDAEVLLRHVLHRAEQPLRRLLVDLEVGHRAAALAPVAREAARDVPLDAHARLVYV